MSDGMAGNSSSEQPVSFRNRIKRDALRTSFVQLADPIHNELAMFMSFVESNEQLLVGYQSESIKIREAQQSDDWIPDRFDDSGSVWTEEFGKSMRYSQILLLVSIIEGYLVRLANKVNILSDPSLIAELEELRRKRATIKDWIEFVTQEKSYNIQLTDDQLAPLWDLLWARNRIVHDHGIFYFDDTSAQATLSNKHASAKDKGAAQKLINKIKEHLELAERNLKRQGFGLSPVKKFPQSRVEYVLTFESEYALEIGKSIRDLINLIANGFQAAVERRIQEIELGPRPLKS